jgi:hypothetical protein
MFSCFQEIRTLKEEKVKASKYMQELSDDLRDAQQERRQLVKMLERYTLGSGREASRTDNPGAYGDDRRADWESRPRDRSRERAAGQQPVARDVWKDREPAASPMVRERGGDRTERIGRNQPMRNNVRDDGDM